VPDVDVILALPYATNTLDAVVVEEEDIEATPRLIFSPIAVLEALALDTALPILIFSPEQVEATDVAEIIVCKSAWSYSFLPYRPVPYENLSELSKKNFSALALTVDVAVMVTFPTKVDVELDDMLDDDVTVALPSLYLTPLEENVDVAETKPIAFNVRPPKQTKVEVALDTAEPFCTLTPATDAIEDVADTIVCKSAWSYSFTPYKPVP
jgi:hypothetical protein